MFLISDSSLIMKVKITPSCLIFATAWTVACQALLPVEFYRPEYWSG